MKSTKRLAGLLFALLFACIPLSVYGASDRPFEAAADLVTNSIKTPSYGWSAGRSYYLGDSIPVYTPEQGELVLHDDTAFFPVYQGSKIAGILTEINSGQRNVSYNFSVCGGIRFSHSKRDERLYPCTERKTGVCLL